MGTEIEIGRGAANEIGLHHNEQPVDKELKPVGEVLDKLYNGSAEEKAAARADMRAILESLQKAGTK